MFDLAGPIIIELLQDTRVVFNGFVYLAVGLTFPLVASLLVVNGFIGIKNKVKDIY